MPPGETSRAIRSAAAGLSLAIALAAPALARAALPQERKAPPGALALEVERFELANGLVVLLAPDPAASGVAVWTSFHAGAVYEPAGRSGLAHLVEHVMASGPTPDTDYAALLERRGACGFNASTGFDRMTFESEVPPEELPLALWVAADRLAALPDRVDAAVVEKSRRIIVQERAARLVDAPYGLVTEQLFARLYPTPHPLHGGVLGVPAELASIGPGDVRAFVAEYLVPANGVLAIVGRFDPAVARRLVEEGVGRLPPGRRAGPPALPPVAPTYVDAKEEPLSREPRVTFAWRLQALPDEQAAALELGAELLTFLTDGAWGMRLTAGLEQYDGEASFELDLTVPYDEPMATVHTDAEGFLRFLTHREMPVELIQAANLALDRGAMLELARLDGRARLLTELEWRIGARGDLAAWLGRHWELDRSLIRDVARVLLRGPHVVVHARPTRPKPARLERE